MSIMFPVKGTFFLLSKTGPCSLNFLTARENLLCVLEGSVIKPMGLLRTGSRRKVMLEGSCSKKTLEARSYGLHTSCYVLEKPVPHYGVKEQSSAFLHTNSSCKSMEMSSQETNTAKLPHHFSAPLNPQSPVSVHLAQQLSPEAGGLVGG